jgi:DNA-binding beta-propeller fold protein YncE
MKSSPAVPRRSVLNWMSGAALAFTATVRQRASAQAGVMLGSGNHRYEWVPDWGPLPGNQDYGNTHGGIVIDEAERLYVNTDTSKAVLMFDTDGRYIGEWGQEFASGLHGMTVVRDCGGDETLWLAHTARHEVVQTTLSGQVLKTLPFPAAAGVYASSAEYQPTGVAVAPNGNIYAADGYGRSYVHQYDATGAYVRSWGGGGNAAGQFNTPHGIWVDTRGAEPLVMVADRENARLQSFDLDGNHVATVSGMLRRPCGVHQHGDEIVVPDLAGRVTILDKNNQLVTHLGDNPDESLRAQNGVARDKWMDGVFISPHSAQWDADGNLYVMDWNFLGRVSKLRRVS